MDLPLCKRARQSPKEFSSLVFSLRPPSVSTTLPCPSCLCQFVPHAFSTVIYILTAAWTSERLSTAATPSCPRLSSRQGESDITAASSISSPVQQFDQVKGNRGIHAPRLQRPAVLPSVPQHPPHYVDSIVDACTGYRGSGRM